MASLSKSDNLGNTNYSDKVAFFGALCLFFATLEYLFPRPVPFFRLGLANLPILLAIDVLPFPYLLVLGLLKVIGQGLIHGTLASYVVLFSFTGTFASMFAMYGAKRIPGMSYIGVSIIGAMVSNSVQVGLSMLIVFGIHASLIIPYFFTMGLLSGTGIGVFANWFSAGSHWYAGQLNREPAIISTASEDLQEEALPKRKRKKRVDHIARILKPGQRFLLGLLLFIPLVFQENLIFRAIHVFLLSLLCIFAGKRLSWFYFLNLTFWITLFQQFSPFGKVLFEFSLFTVTSGAVTAGLNKSLLLIGLVFTSLFSVTSGLQLPGRLGGIVGRMFLYFEELYQGKNRIRRKTFMKDIDRLLEKTQREAAPVSADIAAKTDENYKPYTLFTSKNSGLYTVALTVILFYSIWMIGIYIPQLM